MPDISVSDLIPRKAVFPELSVLLDRIEKTYRPADVLLFGSRARGTATRDSDWDVLVVLRDDAEERLLDPTIGWETQRGSGVYADVLCALRTEFIQDARVVNSLAHGIMDHAVRIGR